MDLIESLEFLENNWDECSQDKSITELFDQSEDYFQNKIHADEIQLLSKISENESIISNLDKKLSAFSQSLATNVNSIDNSIQSLHSLSPQEANENDEEQKQELNDILKFHTLIYPVFMGFRVLRFPPYTEIERNYGNTIKILDEYVEVNQFIHKYPNIGEFQGRLRFQIQDGSRSFQSNLHTVCSTLQNYIVSIFSKNKFQQIEKCRTYYSYLLKLTGEDTINSLLHKCAHESVKTISDHYFPNSLASKIISKVASYVKYDKFDYDCPSIKKFLSHIAQEPLQKSDLPDDAEKQISFRIIKFILFLPDIIKDHIDAFTFVFNSKSNFITSIFLSQLEAKYSEYIRSKDVFKGDALCNPLFWSFLYRIMFYHRQTMEPPPAVMKRTIERMIDTTESVSLDHANELFNAFFQSNPSYLNKEYSAIHDKYYNSKSKRITDEAKYINDLNRVFETLIYPLRRHLYDYFDVIVHRRSNQPWYLYMNNKLAKNQWFTTCIMCLQNQYILTDFDQFNTFDKKNIIPYFCMLNHYFFFAGKNVALSAHFHQKLNEYLNANLESLDHLKEIIPFLRPHRAINDPQFDASTYYTQNYGKFYSEVTKFIDEMIQIVKNSELTKPRIEQQPIIVTEFIVRFISLFGAKYEEINRLSTQRAQRFKNAALHSSDEFRESLNKQYRIPQNI